MRSGRAALAAGGRPMSPWSRVAAVRAALVATATALVAPQLAAQGAGGLCRPAGSDSRDELLAVRDPAKVARTLNPALAQEVVSGATDADAVNAAAEFLRGEVAKAGGG